jgi:hypothetical protein
LIIIRGNFETHIRLQFNLDLFDLAVTNVVSEFGTKADSVTYKQGADNACIGSVNRSEVRDSYQYDQYENWLEQTVSYRSSPDGAFQSSTVSKRRLAHY